jgi:hypothetical protein
MCSHRAPYNNRFLVAALLATASLITSSLQAQTVAPKPAASATATAATPASAPSTVVNCESLRTSIEAKIRANGVQKFSLSIVDSQASASGKVVGSCERGSKKIVYAAAPSTAAPKSAPILTECADGRVLMGGDCRR